LNDVDEEDIEKRNLKEVKWFYFFNKHSLDSVIIIF
jgi:hypothetical protein